MTEIPQRCRPQYDSHLVDDLCLTEPLCFTSDKNPALNAAARTSAFDGLVGRRLHESSVILVSTSRSRGLEILLTN
jgi:hypothetical protein